MESLTNIQILSAISSLISFVLCICMLYVVQTRKTYQGFQQWTMASVFYCVALALMGLRNNIPDFFSIIIANTLIVSGSGLIAYGLELFTGSRSRIRLMIIAGISMLICFLYFTYYVSNVNARIAVISTVIALLYGYSGFLVYKHIPKVMSTQNWFLIFIFFFQAIWNIFRVFESLVFEELVYDYLNVSAFHAVTIAVFFCCNIFLIVGLIVLNFQRVEYDLKIVMEEVKTLRGILPICSYCKKIRDDKGFWNQVEIYVGQYTHAQFSHGVCPECLEKHFPDLKMKKHR